MKKILFLICFLTSAGLLYAQDDPMREKEQNSDTTNVFRRKTPPPDETDPNDWRKKVFFGGNFWLQFGNLTYIDISPVVGYRLTDQLQVGAGVVYQYYRRRDFNAFFPTIETSIYGGRVFGRYFLYSNLFGHAEYESLNLPYVSFANTANGELVRGWIPAFLVGGGYSFPIGGRSALQMTILYNVLWDNTRSFSASPWVTRMGFTF